MAFPVAVEHRPLELTQRRHWYDRTAAPRLDERSYERIKRAIDLLVALVLLPPTLVVVGFCICAIWQDSPGSAWLAQERTGRGGRRFRMFKLRTMVHNANELKAKYMHLNEHSYPDFKITNDPRLTRCGRILRKLSLDELPQLINVLRGRHDAGRATTDLVWRQHVSPVADRAARGHARYHGAVAGHRPTIWTSTIGCASTSPTSATGACGSTCGSSSGRSRP